MVAGPIRRDSILTQPLRISNTCINPGTAVPEFTLSLQTVEIQISWLLKKPTDLDLHCLTLSM